MTDYTLDGARRHIRELLSKPFAEEHLAHALLDAFVSGQRFVLKLTALENADANARLDDFVRANGTPRTEHTPMCAELHCENPSEPCICPDGVQYR